MNYCDEGCNISKYPNLDYCPKGHSGSNSLFFPIYGEIVNILEFEPGNLTPMKDGYVFGVGDLAEGQIVEFEFRRWQNSLETNPKHGLLNWIPMYCYAPNSPYLNFVKETQESLVEEEILAKSSSSSLL